MSAEKSSLQCCYGHVQAEKTHSRCISHISLFPGWKPCSAFSFFSSELRGLWNNSALAEAFPPPSLSLTRLTKLTDRLLTVAWRAGLRLTRFGKDTIPFSHSNINQHADDVRHLHVQDSCAKVLLLRCRHTCDMDHTSLKSACYQNIPFFIPVSFHFKN